MIEAIISFFAPKDTTHSEMMMELQAIKDRERLRIKTHFDLHLERKNENI